MAKSCRSVESRVSDSANLLVSILVRYPEIGSIHFNPKLHTLKLTFLLSKLLDEQNSDAFQRKLSSSLEVYHQIEGYDNTFFDISISQFETITLLDVYRDIETISQEEIGLLITLIREHFKSCLVCDTNDSLMEEDLIMQEEVIQDMLSSLRYKTYEQSMMGFREDGRVMVFNK